MALTKDSVHIFSSSIFGELTNILPQGVHLEYPSPAALICNKFPRAISGNTAKALPLPTGQGWSCARDQLGELCSCRV